MVLPAITYEKTDISHNYGLRLLFWYGRSDCDTIGGNFYCERNTWLSPEGWEE